MPAKLEPHVATVRDLEIFKLHEIENKTLDETALELNISRDTVKRTKKKPVYRDMVLAALEDKGFTVSKYVDKLIGLTDAKKSINIGGEEMEVPDNVTQMKAIEKVGKVFGDDAPKEVNLAGSLTQASDAELLEELTEISAGQELADGESSDCSGDDEPSEGTIL